jgi:hypothetical protein
MLFLTKEKRTKLNKQVLHVEAFHEEENEIA